MTTLDKVRKLEAKHRVRALLRALDARNHPETRQAAAAALGRLSDARAVEPLIRLLGECGHSPVLDRDRSLLSEAIGALGSIGGARAADALAAVCGGADLGWGYAAAIALAELGDARATEPLLASIRSRADPDAARALDKVGWCPGRDEVGAGYWISKGEWYRCTAIGAAAVEPLISALRRHHDDSIGAAAADALAQIGPPVIEPLLGVLKSAPPRERPVVARALAGARWRPGKDETGAIYWAARGDWKACAEIGPLAVGPLIDCIAFLGRGGRFYPLGQLPTEATRGVITALGEIGDGRAVDPLVPYIEHGSKETALAAVAALGKIADGRAIERLLALLGSGKDELRAAAAAALGETGDARAAGALVTAMVAAATEINGRLCGAASEALAKIGPPATAHLIPLLDSADVWLRSHAAEALGRIGDAHAVEFLIAALARGSEAAAEALGRIGDPRCIAPLISVVKQGDRSYREAAIEALGRMGARAVGPLAAAFREGGSAKIHFAKALGKTGQPGAVEPLVAALTDTDAEVNSAAARALESMGWEPGADRAGAAYWIAQRMPWRCVEIGAPAVEPLIADLFRGPNTAFEATARALIALYRSGALDDKLKAAILAKRDFITNQHIDESIADYDHPEHVHNDQDFGVDFPV